MSELEPEQITIWGLHPVEEFLKHSPNSISAIFVIPSFGRKKPQKKLLNLAQKNNVPIKTEPNFTKIGVVAGAVHQGIAAQVKPIWMQTADNLMKAISQGGLFVACDQVTDPQNLGAIIRACAAFGVKSVILPQRSSAKITGTVVKASAGTIIHIKVCIVQNLVKTIAKLQQNKVAVIGLSGDSSKLLWDYNFPTPALLVAGAEGKGLRFLVKKSCDTLLRIPCAPEVESLNVSAALSVALYEAVRQAAFITE